MGQDLRGTLLAERRHVQGGPALLRHRAHSSRVQEGRLGVSLPATRQEGEARLGWEGECGKEVILEV